MSNIVATSRSKIEAYQKCPRLEYETYEFAGKGLDLGSAVPLNIGSAVHKGVETTSKCYQSLWREVPDGQFETPHVDVLLKASIAAAQATPKYQALESPYDQDLVEALLRTWHHVGLPLLRGWEILGVEREETFDYPIVEALPDIDEGGIKCQGNTKVGPTVRFQSRSDLIARAPQGITLPTPVGTLPIAPGLYNWNLKTWRKCGERQRLSLEYDAQVYTELFGPEARLNERFAGVIYQVLIKEDHPLVWAWRSVKTGEAVARFRWRCEEAHENTHMKHGGWCPGNRGHTLGKDFEKVAVRDFTTQAEWFDKIVREDPLLLKDFHIILGPIMRPSDYVMDEWKEMNLPREARIAALRSTELLPESVLRREFPKHTTDAKCVQYAKFNEEGVIIGNSECPAHPICWGSGDRESFGYRIPNHKEE